MAERIIGVRFRPVGKLYHFNASHLPDLNTGDYAIVDTSRGIQLGEVIEVYGSPPRSKNGYWKSVDRKATARDLVLRKIWEKKEVEVTKKSQEIVREKQIKAVKIVTTEISHDGKRLFVLCTTEGDEKVDLSPLQREIKKEFPKMGIDIRQIGPRDEAKIIGGKGACGIDNRCCSRFLTNFKPIGIKMAKIQKISLTPSEITGMCGRLRCCLIFEYQQYIDALKELPKKGKVVITPDGNGTVKQVYPVKDEVLVQLNSGRSILYGKDEIKPYEEHKALSEKAKQPCQIHVDKPCHCIRKSQQDKED